MKDELSPHRDYKWELIAHYNDTSWRNYGIDYYYIYIYYDGESYYNFIDGSFVTSEDLDKHLEKAREFFHNVKLFREGLIDEYPSCYDIK